MMKDGKSGGGVQGNTMQKQNDVLMLEMNQIKRDVEGYRSLLIELQEWRKDMELVMGKIKINFGDDIFEVLG